MNGSQGRSYDNANGCSPCCTGVLEANLNSNVIGVAHRLALRDEGR